MDTKLKTHADVSTCVDGFLNVISDALSRAVSLSVLKLNYLKFPNDKKLESLQVKDTLWQLARAFTKNRNKNLVPTLHGSNGLTFTHDDKANEQAETFEKVHYLTENKGTPDIERSVNIKCREILNTIVDTSYVELVTPKEIREAIHRTKPRKSPGIDGIHNVVLKNLPKKTLVYLVYIFNICFIISYFPETWKIANILPIYNAGKDKLFPQNYRPLSLLTTLNNIF